MELNGNRGRVAFLQIEAHEAEAEMIVHHPHLPMLEEAYAIWCVIEYGVQLYCNAKKIPKAVIEDLLSGINPSFYLSRNVF